MFAGAYGLFTSTALVVYGGEVVRTRALRRWTGWALIAGRAGLLGLFAAFRDAAPFPQFLALAATGAAALVPRGSPHPTAAPAAPRSDTHIRSRLGGTP